MSETTGYDWVVACTRDGGCEPLPVKDHESLIRLFDNRLPADLERLYQAGCATSELPADGRKFFPVRLMPVVEAIEENAMLAEHSPALVAEISWVVTDDNSNYIGWYRSGADQGSLAVMDHEDPNLDPAWNDLGSFLICLRENVEASEFESIDDATMIARDL